MTSSPPFGVVKSRYSFWRNLFPIYSVYQLVWGLSILLVMGGAATALGFDRLLSVVAGGIGGMLAVSYQTRPARMTISIEEGRLVEEMLRAEGNYVQAADGVWRPLNVRWWRIWPHYTIEVIGEGSTTTIFAEMRTMRDIRNWIAARLQN